MKSCIFQICAPLVSWGNSSIGGNRSSNSHPSKSAIVGLIASALGIKREDKEQQTKLVNSISFRIRVDKEGFSINDFQIVQNPKNLKKILESGESTYTTRKQEIENFKENKIIKKEYICDSYLLVSISFKNEEFKLEEIVKALNYPKFHLYFGRKSCVPSLPLHPQIIEGRNMVESFCKAIFPTTISTDKTWEIEKATNFEKSNKQDNFITYYWDKDTEESGINPTMQIVINDEPICRKWWTFKQRKEFSAKQSRKELNNVL